MKQKIQKHSKLPEHWGHMKIDGKCECDVSKLELQVWAENEIKQYKQFIKMLDHEMEKKLVPKEKVAEKSSCK